MAKEGEEKDEGEGRKVDGVMERTLRWRTHDTKGSGRESQIGRVNGETMRGGDSMGPDQGIGRERSHDGCVAQRGRKEAPGGEEVVKEPM